MDNSERKQIMEPFDIRYREKFSIAEMQYFLEHCYCDGPGKIEYVYCPILTPKGRTSIEICTDLNNQGKIEIFDLDDREPEPVKLNREQMSELLVQSEPEPFFRIDLDEKSSK